MNRGNNIKLGQELRKFANDGESRSRNEIIDFLFEKKEMFPIHVQECLDILKYHSILNDTVDDTVHLTSDVINKLRSLGINDETIKNISFTEMKKSFAQRFGTAMTNFVNIINDATLSPAFKENHVAYALKSQRHGDYTFITEDEYNRWIHKNTWHRVVGGVTKLGAINPDDDAMNSILRMLTKYGKTYKLK
jgi:hypothetical protein